MVKNITRTTILVLILYTFLPTGDPTDFLITIPLVNLLGLKLYLLFSAVLVFLLYRAIDGKTINQKFTVVKNEVKSLLSSL